MSSDWHGTVVDRPYICILLDCKQSNSTNGADIQNIARTSAGREKLAMIMQNASGMKAERY